MRWSAWPTARIGHCERCGKLIPVERLEARPYATLCVEDQAREEHVR